MAAQSGIDLALTAYLPSLELGWEANRATCNNITGYLFPLNDVTPTITGGVLKESYKTAWGSAVGALLSWIPYDFGLRRANVNVAKAQLEQAIRESKLTEFNLIAVVIDSYIKVLSAKQLVRASKAYVERAKTLTTLVESLVKSGLRPEVDLNRALTEWSTTKIQLIQAMERERITSIALSQFMGLSNTPLSLEEGALLTLPHNLSNAPIFLANHPILSLQEANILYSASKEVSIARSYVPTINLLAGISARGSGFRDTTQIVTSHSTIREITSRSTTSKGLAPTRSNYGVGISITFDVMDFYPTQARRSIQYFHTQKEREAYDRLYIELSSKIAEAKAEIDAATAIAKQTPLQLEYATASEKQLMSRYEAGLVTVLEVADAQKQLAQADAENDLASLGVWKALLNLSIAQGDLNLFLLEVHKVKQRGQTACGLSLPP